MKNFKYKILLLCIGFSFFVISIKAQQFKPNTEIGALFGLSYYLGDLNTTHFYQASPAGGVVIRKNVDKRFVYKAEAMFINIRADERNSKDTIAANRGLHFRSPVYE